MNKIIALIVVSITFNLTVMAQKKKYKEIRITHTSEIINVSADSLWNIVREFQDVGVWLSGIDKAIGSGTPEFEGASCSERVCHVNVKGFNVLHEKLTLFNDTTRELAYELTEGGPGFVVFVGNHWSVSEIGANQSILKMEATMHLKKFIGFLFGGKIRRTVKKGLPEALSEIKIYAETGNVSEAKKVRIEKLKRQDKR